MDVSLCVETARFDAIVGYRVDSGCGMMQGLTSCILRFGIMHGGRAHMAAVNGVALAKPVINNWPSSLDQQRINCTIYVALIAIPIKSFGNIVSWFWSCAIDSYLIRSP